MLKNVIKLIAAAVVFKVAKDAIDEHVEQTVRNRVYEELKLMRRNGQL